MNRRQRKKLHRGEFVEWGLRVWGVIDREISGAEWDEFIDKTEKAGLMVGGRLGPHVDLVFTRCACHENRCRVYGRKRKCGGSVGEEHLSTIFSLVTKLPGVWNLGNRGIIIQPEGSTYDRLMGNFSIEWIDINK